MTIQVGDSADKVFIAFDKDGDGEVSYDDFKVSMDNEPLGLSDVQVRQLFEFIAGSQDKDITKVCICVCVCMCVYVRE